MNAGKPGFATNLLVNNALRDKGVKEATTMADKSKGNDGKKRRKKKPPELKEVIRKQ